MLVRSATFSFRSLALLLSLVIAAFPAVAVSAVSHCTGHEQVAAACCKQHDKCDSHSSSDNQRQGSDRSCGLTCLLVCCRAIDVARSDLYLVGDRMLVLPVILIAQSIHTPITCDAIFHPPRS